MVVIYKYKDIFEIKAENPESGGKLHRHLIFEKKISFEVGFITAE
jgi:hypothetical protein